MSQLTEWLSATMYPVIGQTTPLADIVAALNAGAKHKRTKEWLAVELLKLGYRLSDEGVKGRPNRVVNDLSFARPAPPKVVQDRIVTIFNHATLTAAVGCWYYDYVRSRLVERVLFREDYDTAPERYVLSYAEIASNMDGCEPGLSCDESDVRATMLAVRDGLLAEANDPDHFEDHRERRRIQAGLYTSDAVLQHRLRLEGDIEDAALPGFVHDAAKGKRIVARGGFIVPFDWDQPNPPDLAGEPWPVHPRAAGLYARPAKVIAGD